MLKIGITGGIGTGKSTVCKIFVSLGVPVLNTDVLAKQIIASNNAVQQSLKENFGDDIFIDGYLQPKILAHKAFASPEKTQLLNSIVHPFVLNAIEEWQQMQNTAYTVRESALLIESKSYEKCDVVIGVTSPMQLRIDRIIARDKCSEAEVLQRMDRQMTTEQQSPFYHHTIINDDQHLLIPQVLALHDLFSKSIE
jgi:dephospho-CoA kinase